MKTLIVEDEAKRGDCLSGKQALIGEHGCHGQPEKGANFQKAAARAGRSA